MIAVLFNITGEPQPDLSTKTGIKNFLTDLAISAEFLPWWSYILFPCVAFLLLAFGVPSIFLFATVLVLKGFYPAFFLTWSAQLLVSICALAWSGWRKKPASQTPIEIRLRTLSSSFWSFAFWSRVYYAFPLRTIDSFTPVVHSEGQSIKSILSAIAPAIAIRILLPSLWLDSIFTMATSLGNNPSADLTRMLLWSSAIVVYTLIPRVPELFICPDSIKETLFCVEEPSRLAAENSVNQIQEVALKGSPFKAPSTKISPVGTGTKPQLVK